MFHIFSIIRAVVRMKANLGFNSGFLEHRYEGNNEKNSILHY